MATYSAGTTIKESGSLKRTTAGTTSKTVGSGEYAIVSFCMDAGVRIEGISSGGDGASEDGSASSYTKVTGAGDSGNQFIVGGGITFSITWTSGGGGYLTIDDCVVFSAVNYSATTVAAQYVIFE